MASTLELFVGTKKQEYTQILQAGAARPSQFSSKIMTVIVVMQPGFCLGGGGHAYHRRESEGEAPSCWAIFVIFLEK